MSTKRSNRLGEFLQQVMEEIARNSRSNSVPAPSNLSWTDRGMAQVCVNNGDSIDISVRVNRDLEVDPDGEANITLKLWLTYL